MYDNPEDSHTIKSYIKKGGYETLKSVLKELDPKKILDEVKESNIRGRGGAGFPTGTKWGFLGEEESRYLVINADESEPGTFKDRILLERDPHQLIE